MHTPPPDNELPLSITPALLQSWPLPTLEGDKAQRGQVLIIAGAVEMPGGAVLVGTAALRAGAGVVQVATAESAVSAVATAVPELFVVGIAHEGDRRQESLRAVVELVKLADVVLIGPELRDTEAIRFLLPELLGMDHLQALIIDTKAISTAAEFLPAKGNCVEKRSSLLMPARWRRSRKPRRKRRRVTPCASPARPPGNSAASSCSNRDRKP